MNSRRSFLQGTATTGIAAATLAAFPPSIRARWRFPRTTRPAPSRTSSTS